IVKENPFTITNESVKTIIYKKKGFFYEVHDLVKNFKPIKDAIIKLESRNAILADCYFALLCLGSSIHKFSDENCKQFHQYAIKTFNSRFKEYESNEYLLAYFLHPGYK
ncbi:10395_t:CDS:1, partial [Gigaspora margarita]